MPKVTGRIKKLKVERHKRFCIPCNLNKIGDEYQILFECLMRKWY